MDEVRHELGLGRVMDTEAPHPSEPLAMEAKAAVAELLDVPINCVSRSRERTAAALEAVRARRAVASRGGRA
jgi:hypothetical protein